MTTTPTKQKGRGFTIIEVMIVLTIAGLILLIVFLAVPALQRNSRNTQRKQDAAAVGAAVAEYTANHNGNLPSTACGTANPYTMAVVTCPGTGNTNFNMGFYTAAPAFATGVQAALTADSIRVVTSAACGANGATAAGGGRQSAVQYTLESSSGITGACQDV